MKNKGPKSLTGDLWTADAIWKCLDTDVPMKNSCGIREERLLSLALRRMVLGGMRWLRPVPWACERDPAVCGLDIQSEPWGRT
jgi:hypothetical protein